MAREGYDAVVYDLDGTLVRLRVDWGAVESALATRLAAAGLDVGDADPWEMLDAADRAGLGDVAHETIAAHERAAAPDAVRLSLADELRDLGRPAGVCSLNDERAVRAALDAQDLTDAVSVVVGRGTVPERKPDPAPLRHAVSALGTDPERTLFVGDSASDEETARRAGVPFAYVGDGPTTRGRE